MTVSLDEAEKLAGKKYPATLAVATKLFPGLLTIRRDSLPCPPETVLAPVHDLKVLERVFTGSTVHFPGGHSRSSSIAASMALILWSKGKKGRILTAEFSFRYTDEKEAFSLEVASAARRFFEGLQYQDWARPEAITKTQYMYGGK